MSKNVLLAGTSYSAVPILQALKSNDCKVSVCGSLQDDPCHALADRSYYIDYSERTLLLDVIQKNNIQYLCPACNDYSYMSCAWVAEERGLPGYDSYENTLILHNKTRFRSFAEKNGFPIPRAKPVHEAVELGSDFANFPMLVKPADSFSGRGMTKVGNHRELLESIKTARDSSRTGEVLVEEYIEGSLHSHSIFIQDGECVFDLFVDEFCTIYPYQVNCSNIPSVLPETVQVNVRECIMELISTLKLNDGLLHTQFMVNGKDFWLIECMRRGPGDLYYHMVELSTGINGMDLYARPFIGERMPSKIVTESSRCYARHTISVTEPTVVSSFSINLSTEDIQIASLKTSGGLLEAAPYDKLAIFFAQFKNKEELFKHTPDLSAYVSIQSSGAE